MPAGKTRSMEERMADLQRQMDNLRRQDQLRKLREATEADAVSSSLLRLMREVDRLTLVPDIAADEVTTKFLADTRAGVVQRLSERGVPAELLEEDDDAEETE